MRLVVVEPKEPEATALADFLLELGHRPRLVRSGEAALAALRTEEPQAILLALDLPGMSGLDFLQLRPVRRSGVPVLALASPAAEDEARQCLRLGALDVIGKPIDRGRLAEVLAYLELGLLGGPATGGTHSPNRREVPRAPIAAAIRLVAYDGTVCEATSIDLSAGGVKLRSSAAVADDAAVKLCLALPDHGPLIELFAALVRRDVDGLAFVFLAPKGEQTERLNALVTRLLAA